MVIPSALPRTAALLFATFATFAAAADDPQRGPLYDEIAAVDKAAFDAFNRCSDPAQLDRHASYFAPDVEFYHDNGGVTWNREAMLADTRKYVCGKFSRQLIPGTLKVWPVKDYGAISQGSHEFCQFASGKCEGMAEFTMVWRKKDGKWEMTRALSYAHRPNEPRKAAAVAAPPPPAIFDLFGIGRGFAAGLAASLPPSATGKQTVAMRGYRVTVTRNDAGVVPLALEVRNTEAVAAISKTLADMTRTASAATYGTPEVLYDGSLRFKGPAASCSEFVELQFLGERLSGINWKFCGE